MPKEIRGVRSEYVLGGFGLGMWALLGLQLGLLAVFLPDQAEAMAIALGTELAFGREAGIPAGLAAGYHPLLMWETSVAQDFATAFLGYPIFLYLLHRFQGRDIYIMRRLRRIEAKAAEHEAYIRKWGPVGIALFMAVPFLVNGPFIALVLGRLTGIHTRHLLAPVITATVVIAGAWTFGVDAMLRVANSFDDQLGVAIAAAAATAVATLAVIDFLREHRHARQDSTDGGPGGRDR